MTKKQLGGPKKADAGYQLEDLKEVVRIIKSVIDSRKSQLQEVVDDGKAYLLIEMPSDTETDAPTTEEDDPEKS